MIPMVFSEVRVTDVASTPVLLLREAEGERVLPIWISASAGNSILSALEPDDPDHPDVHDLLVESLAVLGEVIAEVRITDVVDGVFDAALVIGSSVVAARASDAVALALRCGAPILAAPTVLEAAAMTASALGSDAGAGPDAEVAEFLAFLDTISPKDFEPGPGGPTTNPDGPVEG